MKRHLTVAAVIGIGALATAAFGELPQWYLDTGLPTADSDGDGIPDAWERRTFGDPATPDSGRDRDGDGLTDLEEFAFGSDPRAFSTMGDGWSDKEKRDAGLGAVCRVTPAASLAQWLGWLGWSQQQWRALTAANSQGFAACYADFVNATPPYSQERGAADFWLVTRTDRPAWVTVGDALTTNSFPVRAGSGRVRIRAAYGGPVSLTLNPQPGALAELPGATNGLWLCQMSVEPFRTNTVVFADGETPAVAGEPDSVDGILLLSPPPAASVRSLASPPPSVTLQPLRMTDGAVALGNGGWYCLCASEPPCGWPTYGMVGCDSVSLSMNQKEADTPLLSKDAARAIYAARSPCLQCTVTQTVANATYPFIYGKVIFSFRQCEAVGGVSGAQQHPPRHEPGSDGHSLCGGIGCLCDGGPYWVVGFDHAKVNTRNLTRITTGNNDVDSTEHCTGVVWQAGAKLDLFSLLHSGYGPYQNELYFTTTALSIEDGKLVFGGRPTDLEPQICLIKLHYKQNPDLDWVFDRLWVVVNRPDTETRFNIWYAQNADIGWTTNLPKPFASITFSTNWFGVISPVVTDLSGSGWGSPHAINSYLHHDARYEMRSAPTPAGHGHQATYNTNGILIELAIAAGTADMTAPYVEVLGVTIPNPTWNHFDQDVKPFIQALQLDGNPVLPTDINRNLNRPCIYKGVNTDKYVERRPVLPTGKQ